MIRAVLFDLDGTFADTAPDLAYTLNVMRATRGLPPCSVETTRPVTSTGARGLLRVGFGMAPEDSSYLKMRAEFLEIYAHNLCRETTLFAGMERLLGVLDERGIRWGIVTNKAEYLAKPLIEQLRLGGRCACVVGGDTAPRMKPHPDPLHAAARLLEIAPAACVYVGDDKRDIDAGRAAGMKTIAVRYGYLNGGDPDAWNADVVVNRPEDVLEHL
jgi:2-phosphoglycolate phosphatase